MAGFPFFQLDRFLKMLVQDLNKYVAISEEFPTSVTGKVRSGGLLFDRRVARVVTPGTLIDEKFLDPYENNFLLSVHLPPPPPPRAHAIPSGKEVVEAESERAVGLAWLDLSTGDFFTQTTTRTLLSSALARIAAREIILPRHASENVRNEIQLVVGHDRRLLTLHDPHDEFSSMTCWNEMLESPIEEEADSYFSLMEKLAGHRLLDYVRDRLQGLQLQLQPPRRREIRDTLSIDRNSLRGLEILETTRDSLGKGSLFHAVKRTSTKSGARLLRDRLTSPSASLEEINGRLDLVSTFVTSDDLRGALGDHLRRTYDVQRLVQKFALNKGDADDMLSLARAITETCSVSRLLRSHAPCIVDGAERSTDVQVRTNDRLLTLIQRFDLEGPSELGRHITNAIDEEGLYQKHRLEEDEAADVAALAQEVVMETAPDEIKTLPKTVRSRIKHVDVKEPDTEVEEPWIMRRHASETLRRLHEDLDDLKTQKTILAQTLRGELSAPTLILKSTPGLGHICHIRSATGFNKDKLDSLRARMVSSSKSTRSFYLSDWSRLGSRIDQARLNIKGEEQRLFAELRQQVIRNLVKLRRNASIMDELDVASAFATLAKEQSWVRPLMNTGTDHKIIGGRHPTVKLGLEEQGRSFVSNDLVLDSCERVWLVTGPNMAGKSTFLRQNALITILAQVGSYVPATHAEMGVVDQIFSRIGAADDLFRDQSTFMVEMVETAAILTHATPRSFVIMDEVGRGTTPEDGTAVGYATLHHLYNVNKCRTLFATHFHALADMTHHWPQLGCYCTDVLEDAVSGSFSFVHRLRKGVNRQSHALKVAKLAGLPAPALRVAEDVLHRLSTDTSIVHAPTPPAAEDEPWRLAAAAG